MDDFTALGTWDRWIERDDEPHGSCGYSEWKVHARREAEKAGITVAEFERRYWEDVKARSAARRQEPRER